MDKPTTKRPRLLIEDWLPAQAIGVECMREENNPTAKPPNTYLHVWWARRPLVVSRAAVLASILPSDFDRSIFEKLLGFGKPSKEIVRLQAIMDSGVRLGGFGFKRAFSNPLHEQHLSHMKKEFQQLWGNKVIVLDPMAGGGSIPFEASRLGVNVIANEYNPVACTILEVTLGYSLKYGVPLAEKARKWGKIWRNRCVERLSAHYPKEKFVIPDGYIFCRAVPCPDTQHYTPLVPDWHLLKSKKGLQVVAEPIVDKKLGTWTVRIREIGNTAGQLSKPPIPTYDDGGGISLFTNKPIPSDYIKAMAQQGKMRNVLYATAIKAGKKLEFRPSTSIDVNALEFADHTLSKIKSKWESIGILPTESYPEITSDERPRYYGMPKWSDMFSSRQLLALGVMVEELKTLHPGILEAEGDEWGNAVIHLLSYAIDKIANFNCLLSRWTTKGSIAGKFDRHDYAFKPTFAELAICEDGSGLEWAIRNVTKAYQEIAELPHSPDIVPTEIYKGSATSLIELDDKSITAVVVDPPYADNVQYSEMADFFYVWLKRTQGYRKPDWFSTSLSDRDQEAVVNVDRHRKKEMSGGEARILAQSFYERQMLQIFLEANRVLRDDGVLTVMFTHKEQSAWASLFESLIAGGFIITATWPIKTEGDFSLHQAQKNAAQSTVVLVSRKREAGAGRGYFDDHMQAEIRTAAQSAAARLRDEGLNAVDQLVGAFGPAMEVFSRYDEVYTDTGQRVAVAEAIQMAANAVADWRVEQLAARGLEGVNAESRFVLLCWDVLGAVEFRFNEAMLLGRSVGMDVNTLIALGLVTKKGDKVLMNAAAKRRREEPVKTVAEQLDLLGNPAPKRKRAVRAVHPQDQYFVSAIDMCHALAMRHAEAGGGEAGIGAAKGMALQQGWNTESPCARLMDALVHAAPQAVRFAGKGKSIADEFPEFRAWHAMLKPLFNIEPPKWDIQAEAQPKLFE